MRHGGKFPTGIGHEQRLAIANDAWTNIGISKTPRGICKASHQVEKEKDHVTGT